MIPAATTGLRNVFYCAEIVLQSRKNRRESKCFLRVYYIRCGLYFNVSRFVVGKVMILNKRLQMGLCQNNINLFFCTAPSISYNFISMAEGIL